MTIKSFFAIGFLLGLSMLLRPHDASALDLGAVAAQQATQATAQIIRDGARVVTVGYLTGIYGYTPPRFFSDPSPGQGPYQPNYVAPQDVPRQDVTGASYQVSQYAAPAVYAPNCHDYVRRVWRNGRVRGVTGLVCQQPDGSWLAVR